MPKKLFIKSYGCQMNAYDSARMADVMAACGYVESRAAEDADLVILNTCHIREKASEKVFSELGRLRLLRRARGERFLIAVAGCVAQAEGAELLARAPFVDIVIGPQSYHHLPRLVARAERGERALLDTEFPADSKFDALPARSDRAVSAFLSIQEGCDKFCTFCVVPYTRGAEYSRPAGEVLDEARRLLALGARELTLLGQNVNAYHGAAPDGSQWGLGRLIRALAELPGLLRLRYTTSHPRDVDDALIAAHRDVPAVMPFLHLPVQSGSDRVLAAMNRKHTAADYRRTVDRLRAARPDLALSSDFIVGYPGETAAEFALTLSLARDIGFSQAFSFKYSARPGTPAAAAADQVAEAEKDRRLAALIETLRAQQHAYNQSFVGRTVPVLFEKSGRQAGQIGGKTPYFQAVHAPGPMSLIGRVAEVRIERDHAFSLEAQLITLGDVMAEQARMCA